MPRRRTLLVATTALGLAAVAALPGTAAAVTAPGVPPLHDTALEVLTTGVQDPTALEVAPDGTVVIAERKGAIKVLTTDGKITTAGRIPVSANQCADCPDQLLNEGGLHGLLLDRDFATTGLLYARYSVPGTVDPATGEGIFRLSTFVLDGTTLDLSSQRTILDTRVEWAQCCHYGGDLEWMADGTILLSVGDDTNPFESNGFSPTDKRPGRAAFDAERTSSNKADPRGKVLRLNPDGSVPADNPHVGDPAYDPYVYAMGFRSNYRIGYDARTGSVVVGNVGPDARLPDSNRGPEGWDEIEIIPRGGGTDHGWPHCIADNRAYRAYDFDSGTAGPAHSCAGKIPAEIYWSYNPGVAFPGLLHGSGRTAIGGPVYRYAGTGKRALPARFQGQAIFGEWSRNALYTVPMKADGHLDTGQLLPFRTDLRHPIDLKVGPDGALYVAEYGTGYWNNTNSRISRVVCSECVGAGPSAGPAAPGVPGGVPLGVGAVALLGTVLAVGTWRRRAVA